MQEGFGELGIRSEILKPAQLLSRLGEIRDERVLKILSTTGMFVIPVAKRAIGVAHCIPLATEQGWPRLLGLLLCYKLTSIYRRSRLVAVSDYGALHLKHLFNIRPYAVLRDPLSNLFLEPFRAQEYERSYVTFVGRLVPYKQLDLLLPAVSALLDENPELRCRIIGEGPCRIALEQSAADSRIDFLGYRDAHFIREQLRRTKIFLSGGGTETLGIVYLEALSQGAILAVPASGGGIEIALNRVGENLYLLPISLNQDEVLGVLRRALKAHPPPLSLAHYSPRSVASAYLEVDRSFFAPSHAIGKSVSVGELADV
jgi:glycosyltransferase involved in cell wall biosynthesis